MRKLVLVVLLAGCASEEQLRQRDEQRAAVLAYIVAMCEQQGIRKENEQAMRGCVMAHIARASSSGSRVGQALQESGRVLQAPRPSQNCSTRPDYLGGWTTTCN